MALAPGYEVELFEAGSAEETGAVAELLRFWSDHSALDPVAARARLPHVVCILRGSDGSVAGSSSAVAGDVDAIGGRRFWVFRCLCPTPEARAAVEPMLIKARAQLSERAGADGVKPLGICFPVADPTLIAERDEAVWPESGMLFAGWSANREQLRISYFEDAVIQ